MNIFSKVFGRRPKLSVFDLSHEYKATMDLGYLYPVLCEEVVPGDRFRLGAELVIRFQPLVAPILHEINAFIHWFFVPYRLLWSDWENFVTTGPAGDLAPALPRWTPSGAPAVAKGSLWDYLGFPTGVIPGAGGLPVDFPRRAYARIWNEFYRDANHQVEVAETNEAILKRAWLKDYFTSALSEQQRGIAPAVPISGTSSAVFNGNAALSWPAAGGATGDMKYDSGTNAPGNAATKSTLERGVATKATLDQNVVDLSSATTFNVADLRLVTQIQRWMELNMRGGSRYTESLRAHFGVAPRDDRLQRCEFIGGYRSLVIVSEVLQTSSTDATTPQGNLAGHGVVADRSRDARYTAQEFGLIMGLMSVMPRAAYQQGVSRQWLRETVYDYYFPEFAHLSEQPVTRAELYASAVEAENRTVFGYQGRYNELRYRESKVVAEMRDTFDYWHLGRQFVAAPELNAAFVECSPRKDFLAAPSEPAMVVNLRNVVVAARPLPIASDPGMMDH